MAILINTDASNFTSPDLASISCFNTGLIMQYVSSRSTLQQVPRVAAGGHKGASRYYITAGQIKHMLSLNFSVTKIAQLLGVSRKTLSRKMK